MTNKRYIKQLVDVLYKNPWNKKELEKYLTDVVKEVGERASLEGHSPDYLPDWYTEAKLKKQDVK